MSPCLGTLYGTAPRQSEKCHIEKCMHTSLGPNNLMRQSCFCASIQLNRVTITERIWLRSDDIHISLIWTFLGFFGPTLYLLQLQPFTKITKYKFISYSHFCGASLYTVNLNKLSCNLKGGLYFIKKIILKYYLLKICCEVVGE